MEKLATTSRMTVAVARDSAATYRRRFPRMCHDQPTAHGNQNNPHKINRLVNARSQETVSNNNPTESALRKDMKTPVIRWPIQRCPNPGKIRVRIRALDVLDNVVPLIGVKHSEHSSGPPNNGDRQTGHSFIDLTHVRHHVE